jgi:hypothetical protein
VTGVQTCALPICSGGSGIPVMVQNVKDSIEVKTEFNGWTYWSASSMFCDQLLDEVIDVLHAFLRGRLTKTLAKLTD